MAQRFQSPLDSRPEYAEVVALAGMKSPWPTVYICGPNGNGKTHMGTWLYHIWHLRQKSGYKALQEQGKDSMVFPPRARWITEHMLCQGLKNFSRDGFDYQREFQDLTSLEMLYIDDIITEKTTDTDISNIVEIIDVRQMAMKPTIITGNRDPLAIDHDVSRRFAERLVIGKVLVFDGPSFRMQQFMEQ